MNRLLATASMFALVICASQAQAAPQAWPNWYVGLSGGVPFLNDTDVKGASAGKLDYTAGGEATASLGYVLPSTIQPFSNMRIEAEGGYHYNALDSVRVGNGATVSSAGQVQTYSYMGNLYYDFRNGSTWTPYVGGGAGGAEVNLSRNSGLGNSGNSDNVFAYQFLAGLTYAPKSMPMTEWGIGYRYFVATHPEFRTASGSELKLDDLKSNVAEINARFRF